MNLLLWARMGSNHRKLTLADLQSASFSHSDTDPEVEMIILKDQEYRHNEHKGKAIFYECQELIKVFLFV